MKEEEVWSWTVIENIERNSLHGILTGYEGSPYLYKTKEPQKHGEEPFEIPSTSWPWSSSPMAVY